MNMTIPENWRQVTPDLFNEFLTLCADYRSDGWANGIVYYFRHNGDRFGFQQDVVGSPTYWLDPQFLAE